MLYTLILSHAVISTETLENKNLSYFITYVMSERIFDVLQFKVKNIFLTKSHVHVVIVGLRNATKRGVNICTANFYSRVILQNYFNDQ